jgi:phage terminase large subunit
MVKVTKRGQRLWVEELIYETGLTNEDIYQRLIKLKIPSLAVIIADAAEPKTIETLRRFGYRNTQPAVKGPDSIRAGIDKLRTFEVHVDPQSSNLINEYYNYAWRAGTDKPVDDYNHLMDALRYALSKDKGSARKYAVVGHRGPVEEIF